MRMPFDPQDDDAEGLGAKLQAFGTTTASSAGAPIVEPTPHVLRLTQVTEITGLKKTTIYKLQAAEPFQDP